MNKLLNLLLLITFQFGYLQWGTNNHAYIFEVTADLFSGATGSLRNFLHPAILLPFVGEILVLITLFRKNPNRVLTFTGLACMGLLMLLLLVIGVLSTSYKIMLSTIPFFVIALLIIRSNRKGKIKNS